MFKATQDINRAFSSHAGSDARGTNRLFAYLPSCDLSIWEVDGIG